MSWYGIVWIGITISDGCFKNIKPPASLDLRVGMLYWRITPLKIVKPAMRNDKAAAILTSFAFKAGGASGLWRPSSRTAESYEVKKMGESNPWSSKFIVVGRRGQLIHIRMQIGEA